MAAASCGGAPRRYDVIQASLVDTWAATAAGAYTLTENTLYTVEAFNDYLDHLTDDGVLTITRWVFDGLRLVSLAQEACEPRGWSAARSARDRPARPTSPRFCSRRRRSRRRRSRRFATRRARARVRRALRARRRQAGASTAARAPTHDRRTSRDGAARRLRAAHPGARPAAVLRDLSAGHPADDRRPAVLLPHDEARAISSRSRSAGRCCSATG